MYSCLTQFTAPELLTGNNKWACERCSKIAAEKKRLAAANGGGGRGMSSSEADSGDDDDDQKDSNKKSGKETVYSNASKQGRRCQCLNGTPFQETSV